MRLTIVAATAASFAAVVAQETSPSGPTMTGTAPNCVSWYTVKEGDTCPSVQEKFNITADQFFNWNPAVSRDCITNFWVGESYCVWIGKPVQTTSTNQVSSSTSTKGVSTTSDASDGKPYSTRFPITSRNITTPTSPTDWPPTKTQAGEPDSCTDWHFVVPGDTCQRIVNRYGNTLNMRQLLTWNPALQSDCSALFIGYYVCIAIKSTTSSSFDWYNTPNTIVPSPTAWTPSVPPSINSTFTASPQQSGIPSSCNEYWLVGNSDTCRQITSASNIILEDFLKWNPAVNDGGSCKLTPDVNVCVGVKN